MKENDEPKQQLQEKKDKLQGTGNRQQVLGDQLQVESPLRFHSYPAVGGQLEVELPPRFYSCPTVGGELQEESPVTHDSHLEAGTSQLKHRFSKESVEMSGAFHMPTLREVHEGHQLQKEAPLFCILPREPLHDNESRDVEVAKIAQHLKELKESSDNMLSSLYISGNSRSGNSKVAGLAAKRFFNEVKEMPGASPFVMTLNAASFESLLTSYVSFARLVRCPAAKYTLMLTLRNKYLKIEEKIAYLKALIAEQIGYYTTWLLVVDNVTNLSSVHDFLPTSGDERWAKGQLLITTQDTASIPSRSFFINHISLSKGMELDKADFFFRARSWQRQRSSSFLLCT